jgi:hypothetical protein
MQARVNQLTDAVQRMQYREAQLTGVGFPSQEAATLVPEGNRIISPSGHVWRKKDGIIYHSA